jgi:hypothetical protein
MAELSIWIWVTVGLGGFVLSILAGVTLYKN